MYDAKSLGFAVGWVWGRKEKEGSHFKSDSKAC